MGQIELTNADVAVEQQPLHGQSVDAVRGVGEVGDGGGEAVVQPARDPANTQWQRDLSVSHTKIGDVLVAQGDGAGALAAYRQGLAIAEALTARDPANTQWQRDLIVSFVKLSEVTGDRANAEKALHVALGMQQRGALAPSDAWIIEELERRCGR